VKGVWSEGTSAFWKGGPLSRVTPRRGVKGVLCIDIRGLRGCEVKRFRQRLVQVWERFTWWESVRLRLQQVGFVLSRGGGGYQRHVTGQVMETNMPQVERGISISGVGRVIMARGEEAADFLVAAFPDSLRTKKEWIRATCLQEPGWRLRVQTGGIVGMLTQKPTRDEGDLE